MALLDDGMLVTGGRTWYSYYPQSPADFPAVESWPYVLRFTDGGVLLQDRVLSSMHDATFEAVIAASDGGAVFAGQIRGLSGVSHAYLVKTNAAGAPQWTQQFEFDSWSTAQALCPAPGGGYALAGTIGADQPFVARTGASGEEQWRYAPDRQGEVLAIQPAADGGFVITGEGGPVDFPLNLTKLSGDGEQVWTREYPSLPNSDGIGIHVHPTGGYVIAGTLLSVEEINGVMEYRDVGLLARTDGAGALLWSETYPGLMYFTALDMIATPDSGYLLAGYSSPDGNFDSREACVVKTDADGQLQWEQSFASEGYALRAHAVQVMPDGRFAVAGTAQHKGQGGSDGVFLVFFTREGVPIGSGP